MSKLDDRDKQARKRAKHYLLNKYRNRLDTYDGPGDVALVDDYTPMGLLSAVDVWEIAGLIVWERDHTAHHFSLGRDGGAMFIESPADPDAPICIDPIERPVHRFYLSAGVPQEVNAVLEFLDVTPEWGRACSDGSHEFEHYEYERSISFWQCDRCDLPQSVLSWMGHAVSRGEPP